MQIHRDNLERQRKALEAADARHRSTSLDLTKPARPWWRTLGMELRRLLPW